MTRIAYLSWPASEISGGIKLAYRHVEVLQQQGHNAFVATEDGQSPQWFPTTAPTHQLAELRRQSDILVFPENHPGLLAKFASWPNRKLVFCQNQFMAYRGLGKRRCYSEFGISHILAEGNHVANFCRLRFPKISLSIVPVLVDEDLFRLREQKRLQICFMPRKRPQEAQFIHDLFRSLDDQTTEVPWLEISGRPETEVAALLGSSTIYLSLARFESCGMSVLEAMSCGCIVAGFTGIGGREFANSRNGYWAEEDDCLSCARLLKQAVDVVREQGDLYQQMLRHGIETARQYRRSRFTQHVATVWQTLMSNGGLKVRKPLRSAERD